MNDLQEPTQPDLTDSLPLADVFDVRPQDRHIDGYQIFIDKEGKSHKYPMAWSIPMDRCNGCPVYKIDNKATPTAYYCQDQFLFGAFHIGIKDGTIPDSCMIQSVVSARKYIR